jgi:hypothetical protein
MLNAIHSVDPVTVTGSAEKSMPKASSFLANSVRQPAITAPAISSKVEQK